MRRPRRPFPTRISHDRWLVSYADFVTLLFAFFTTMYAISTVDARKLNAVVDSMQAAFARGDVPSMPKRIGSGTTPSPGHPMVPTRGPRTGTGDEQAVPVDELKTRVAARLNRAVTDGLVDLEIDPRGLVVSIKEAGSFPTGSAELSLTARALLADIASALLEVSNFVRVEGHTDDVPIHTAQYASNWELSTARATAVVGFFLEHGLAPTRLSAAGYGEFHPRVGNDDGPNRARNRRVDVVVLNPITLQREEPGQQAPAPPALVPPTR